MEKGVPIRSISRSIAVLQCINGGGALSLTEIARVVKLPYPTTVRIIQTLMHEGLVACEPVDKKYRATCMVESLAAGYREDGKLVDVAQRHMVALTRSVVWPVTLSSAVGTSVMIRTCTHSMSALTLSQYYRGDTFPMLECAPGHVQLAFSDDTTRECLLQGLERERGQSTMLGLFRSGLLTRRIRSDGYAAIERTLHTKNPGKTSTISVPVNDGGRSVAQLSLNYFASAMPLSAAVQKFLPELQRAAEAIADDLNQGAHAAGTTASPAALGLPAETRAEPGRPADPTLALSVLANLAANRTPATQRV